MDLVEAVQDNNLELVKDLLRDGVVDPNNIIKSQNSWERRRLSHPSLEIAVKNKNLQIATLLLNYEVNPDSSLHIAIDNNDVEMLELLLNHYTHLESVSYEDIFYHSIDVIRVFLNRIDDLDIKDINGVFALFEASSHGIDITEVVLENGADPNIQDDNGDTIIFINSKYNMIEMVELILKYNIDLNIKNKKGRTALLEALDFSDGLDMENVPGIVKLLLEHGADPTIKDENGKSVLELLDDDDDDDDDFFIMLRDLKKLIKFYTKLWNIIPKTIEVITERDITFQTKEKDEYEENEPVVLVDIHANKKKLIQNSKYFRSLFSGNWKEEKQTEFDVDPETPWSYKEAFQTIVNFMETGYIGDDVSPQVALDILPAGIYYELNIEDFEIQVASKLLDNFDDEGVRDHIENIDGLDSSLWKELF